MSETTALARIESAIESGALVYVDKDWAAEQTPLYKPEVTEIKISKENDCFNISGKFMPKREIVDKIGEANGIDFIFGEAKNITIQDEICGKRTVYTAVAQGKRRMSDGSYRKSSKCDYEFDPVLRAMLDYDITELNAETKQKRKKNSRGEAYGSTLARYILELQKVAAQRANTGARLRVIRELVGMPIAFDAKDIDKPLYFGRIVQNTSYILSTPEGKIMANANALGVDVASLFGRPSLTTTVMAEDATCNTVNNEQEQEQNQEQENNASTDEDVDFPVDDNEAERVELEQFKEKTVLLEQYMMTYKEQLNVGAKNGVNPYDLAQKELDSQNATLESRSKMVDKVRDFLIKKHVQGVA